MNKAIEKYRVGLIILLPISTLFDAYKITNIKNFSITLSMILITLILSISLLISLRNSNMLKKNIISVIVFLIFICINFIYSQSKNYNSLVLCIFFFVGTVFTFYRIYEEKFNEYIYLFSKCITIISGYAIYQFIARIVKLPFADIWFNGYMVEGFNWSNPVYFSNNVLYRSNGIFKEPSFLSQYAALAILIILINLIKNEKNNTKYVVMIFINIMAMILSMAGTGVIVLFGGITLIFLKSSIKEKKKVFKLFIYLLIILTISLALVNIGYILEYMLARVNEVRYGTSSGGARFTLSFKSLVESLKINPLMGIGLGEANTFLQTLSFSSRVTADNNITRIGIELGLLGLGLWFIFQFSLINVKKMRNDYFCIIFYFILVINITGDNFLLIHTWAFIYFINLTFINNNNSNKEVKGELV